MSWTAVATIGTLMAAAGGIIVLRGTLRLLRQIHGRGPLAWLGEWLADRWDALLVRLGSRKRVPRVHPVRRA